MQSEELKPCPFCGSSDVRLRHHQASQMSWVSCVGCGLEAPSETGKTDDQAVSYWNRRAEAALSAAEPVDYQLVFSDGRTSRVLYSKDEAERFKKASDITVDIRALYAAPPAPSVAVKELEWSPRNDQPQYEVCADTPFGRYKTSNKGEYGFGWMQPRQTVWSGFLPTLEEAKAAAQADYEARIRSALSAQVQDVAAKSLADAYQKYLDASRLYNERLAISKTKAPGTMRVDEEYRAIDEARRAFDKLAVDIAKSALPAAPAKQEG